MQGLLIIGITLAIGAAIFVPNFDNMYANPPPVTRLAQAQQSQQPPAQPAAAGTTQIIIHSGAAVKGNPNFDPNDAQVPLGNKIVWVNQDNVPHTATSGTGSSDPNSGKVFDTTIINPGESSKPVDTKDMKVGDTIAYYCQIHPYMTGKITITAAASGGAASGPALTILSGAAVKGNPNFQPDELTAKKGDTIQVTNQDNVPHTVTSGTGSSDPDSGKYFDTKIIDPSGSASIDTSNMPSGSYPFYCQIHPYMTGKITIT